MANILKLLSHVAITAVVTEKQELSSRVISEKQMQDAQWPEIAQKSAIEAILKPSSCKTRA